MSRPKTDQLLTALIAQLPPAGQDWAVERQDAWLDLMRTALRMRHGGGVPAPAMDVYTHLKGTAALKPAPRPKPTYPFIIDEQGFAKNGKTQKRIMPSEVEGDLFDLRGMDGDMKTITWADDSTGLNGVNFNIAAA